MKKIIKITLLIVFLLALSGLALIFYADKEARKQQQRPINVPKSAVWKGAQDEGFWIYIASLDTVSRTVRVKIYNDYDGRLALDANFSEKKNCVLMPFTKAAIYENILAYAARNGIERREEIILKNNCSLIMIKPAFGG